MLLNSIRFRDFDQKWLHFGIFDDTFMYDYVIVGHSFFLLIEILYQYSQNKLLKHANNNNFTRLFSDGKLQIWEIVLFDLGDVLFCILRK